MAIFDIFGLGIFYFYLVGLLQILVAAGPELLM